MWPFVVGGASCFVFTRRPLPELSQWVVLLTCYGRGGEGGEQEEEDGDGRPLTAGHDLGPQGRPCPVGSPPPQGHHQPGARGGSDRIPPCSRSGPYRALMGPLCLGRAGSGHHRTELWKLLVRRSCCRPDSGLWTGRVAAACSPPAVVVRWTSTAGGA